MGFDKYSPVTNLPGLPSWLTQAQTPDFNQSLNEARGREYNEYQLEDARRKQQYVDQMQEALAQIDPNTSIDELRNKYASEGMRIAAEAGYLPGVEARMHEMSKLDQAKAYGSTSKPIKVGNQLVQFDENGVPHVVFEGREKASAQKASPKGQILVGPNGEEMMVVGNEQYNQALANGYRPPQKKDPFEDMLREMGLGGANPQAQKPAPVPSPVMPQRQPTIDAKGRLIVDPPTQSGGKPNPRDFNNPNDYLKAVKQWNASQDGN